MIESQRFLKRRLRLHDKVKRPILLCGNGNRARNLPLNTLPFRQDSSFLYYTGCVEPNAAVLISDSGHHLFLEARSEDDGLWHGPTPKIEERAEALGFSKVSPRKNLRAFLPNPDDCVTIAIADEAINREIGETLNTRLKFGVLNGDQALIDAVIHQRRVLDASELESMRQAQRTTAKAHISAMQKTRPGVTENDVAVAFRIPVLNEGLEMAYTPIVTVDGHVLHNHRYHNTLRDGQLLLLDGGAESRNGYATDVTRTWPVNGKWSGQQREAYEAVLNAQERAISLLTVGRRYREVHLASCLAIAEFLGSVGLLNCTPETAVEIGAHALFFPHGVGHLIGLDVHDLENFGDRAAYAPGRERSEQFGTAYLRLDLDMEENMVVTIEPGFYVVPEILNKPVFRDRFKNEIAWDKLENWWGFGGIRIEDDVHVTHDGPINLSFETPKDPDAILDFVGRS